MLVPGGNTVSRCALITTLGVALAPGTFANHVSFGVEPHVPEAELAEHLGEQLRPLGFLERRRFDLAKPDLIGDRLGLVRASRFDSRANRWCLLSDGPRVSARFCAKAEVHGSRPRLHAKPTLRSTAQRRFIG
jgi:hypothetical protein